MDIIKVDIFHHFSVQKLMHHVSKYTFRYQDIRLEM